MAAAATVIVWLVASGQPALATPAGPDTGEGTAAAPAGPSQAWRPDVKKSDPVTLPGTDRKITPFATPLNPTQPKALPGAGTGTGAAAKADGPAAAAVPRAISPLSEEEAGPNWPGGDAAPLYCSEQVSRGVSVSGAPNQLDYAANINYTAALGCNFYLSSAYLVAGVVDRGRLDGQFLYTTTPVTYGSTYQGGTSGAVSIPGELSDGGRNVEIVFELYLRTPNGIPWTGCLPLTELRYLLCEGLGTDLLHIVLGTGTIATGLQPPVIRYVALGDSYSSGTGAPPYFDDQCARSTATYPNLIAGRSIGGLPVDRPVQAACIGATTTHLYTSQFPGVPAQLDAVRANTRLVTLTIGGNDLGFADNLIRCMNMAYDCSAAGPLVTTQQLSALRAQLTALYQQIRAQMHPAGRLIVLSYPAVLPNPDDTGDRQPADDRCYEVSRNLTYGERQVIYDGTVQVDSVIRDAATATGNSGVTYVNGLELFRGHRICSDTPWANNPELLSLRESFHPNAAGYQAMASFVAGQLTWP